MNLGMMWYDGDQKKSFARKVQEAGAFYKNKYGAIPDVCIINPADMTDAGADQQAVSISIPTDRPLITRDLSIDIKTSRSIMPGHLWIGVEEQS